MQNKTKTIQSVQRAIDIINCVADANRKISLNEISAELDLNVNTVRGLIQTLLVNGFLSRDAEQGTYSLGYEFFTKSKQLYENQMQHIRDTAYPDMKQLAEVFNVTVCLQINFHSNIYTIETVEPPHSAYAYVPASGITLPLHASASGKILIAYSSKEKQAALIHNCGFEQFTEHTITNHESFLSLIEKVHERGYATELDEMSLGVGCIAAPIFDARTMLSGTLSVVGSSIALRSTMSKLTQKLTASCNRITDAISFRKTYRNRTEK